MWLACPLVFRMLTPSGEVQALAAQVLRIGLSLLLVGRLGLHGEKGAALWKRKAAIPVFVILNAMDAAHTPPHAAAAERKIGKP